MLVTWSLAKELAGKHLKRLDKSKIHLLGGAEGILPFKFEPSQSDLNSKKVSGDPIKSLQPMYGNILVDASMTSPIQIINREREPIGRDWMSQIVANAIRKRNQTFKGNKKILQTKRSPFRLLNGLGDGIPGIHCDVYGLFGVIHVYSRFWWPHVSNLAKTISSEALFDPIFNKGIESKNNNDSNVIDEGSDGIEMESRQIHGVYVIDRTRQIPSSRGNPVNFDNFLSSNHHDTSNLSSFESMEHHVFHADPSTVSHPTINSNSTSNPKSYDHGHEFSSNDNSSFIAPTNEIKCAWGKKAHEHRTVVEEIIPITQHMLTGIQDGLLKGDGKDPTKMFASALFHINFKNGAALGLYMDQRTNRQRIISLLNNTYWSEFNKKLTSLKAGAANTGNSEESGVSWNPTDLLEKVKVSMPKRRFLNTFSFTGSFSIASALDGTVHGGCDTINVDASEPALLWSIDNFILNGARKSMIRTFGFKSNMNYDTDQEEQSNTSEVEFLKKVSPSSEHHFIKGDVFVALSKLIAEQKSYHVVLLDPPTISRVKIRTKARYSPTGKAKNSIAHFSTNDNYSDLVSNASRVVSPGGYLVCFVNTHSLDSAKWESAISEGLEHAQLQYAKFIEEERLAEVRSWMRKVGVKTKYRSRILEKLMRSHKLSPDQIKHSFNFEITDKWKQDDRDYCVTEGDESYGYYLHGIVLQRKVLIPMEQLIPSIPKPSIRPEWLHESKKPRKSSSIQEITDAAEEKSTKKGKQEI